MKPSAVINNLKLSFNKFLSDKLGQAVINFDQDDFSSDIAPSWYAVRYGEFEILDSGMGNRINPANQSQAFIHRLDAEIGCYAISDTQKKTVGDMADKIVEIAESDTAPFFDYSNPETPVESGVFYIVPGHGKFLNEKNYRDGEKYSEHEISGFILNIKLEKLAEAEL